MANISNLGYVGFGVRNLDRWEDLMVNVLGLQAGHREPGHSLALRMDDHMQRIILESDESDDLIYAGWMFDTEGALSQFVGTLSAQGVQVNECDGATTTRRCVEKAFFCMDPNGVRHEFAVGPRYAKDPFKSSVLNQGFVAGHRGVGHILTAAKDYSATLNFARDVLGLRLSDYIRAPLETPHGVVDVDATFFHTFNGRHHSFATAPVPIPKKLHHIMLEVEDFNDVGKAYDRCLAAGHPLAMGLGHHPNDQMFSFYIVTPSSFLLELGHGGLVVDDSRWETKTYAQLSDWGHTLVKHD